MTRIATQSYRSDATFCWNGPNWNAEQNLDLDSHLRNAPNKLKLCHVLKP